MRRRSHAEASRATAKASRGAAWVDCGMMEMMKMMKMMKTEKTTMTKMMTEMTMLEGTSRVHWRRGLARGLRGTLPLVLVLAGGCKGEEGTTEGASSEAGSTAGTQGETTQATSTGGVEGSGTEEVPTTGEDPTAPTTGEPVACDTPEGCTGVGSGEIASTVVPFFRGEVCLNDKLRPDDPVVLSLSTCVHPCLATQGYAFKWVYRCVNGACEFAVVNYHAGVTGSQCPADVFGAFDPAGCKFIGPDALEISKAGTMGSVSLLLPFLSNEDAAAIAGGDNEGPSVWARIDAHAQADERRVTLDFSPTNPGPPASCAEGTPGCTCHAIMLP